ncbi:ParA family protein [Pollutimonas bauzanensis]|uniref:Chromosome partitioning protein n=1 Tax=Pollutimonas bauzanensis TaxID=658167 RepID=A0A1M5YKN4_9BURK|nr:ParA family protein [Pollutimonas bauzanensis]SHI12448.1 chromosome partitioning protein [Pollutimonas bauzanensis]
MKIFVVAGGKGGVGKTACAAHTAFFSHEAGLRTLAVDLDTGNLSKTLAAYDLGIVASALFGDTPPERLAAKQEAAGSQGPIAADVALVTDLSANCHKGRLDLIRADNLLPNLIYLPLEQALSRFTANLQRFGQDYDLCVIDTAPGLGIALAAALHAADAVISPVEMEAYSIEGIKYLMRTILNARQRNPRLSFLGILPSRVDRRNPRQVTHLAQVRATQGTFVVPLVVGLRSSVAEALALGVPVWKLRKTSARAAGVEMRTLGNYVLIKMGVLQ